MNCLKLSFNPAILQRSSRLPRYQARHFFLSRLRQNDGHHHNYFRKDSPQVNFPIANQQPLQRPYPSSPLYEHPPPPPIYASPSSRSQRWTDRIIGFLAYPVLTSILIFILAQGWIPGVQVTTSWSHHDGNRTGIKELHERIEEFEITADDLTMLMFSQVVFAHENLRSHMLLLELLGRSGVATARSPDGQFPLVVRNDDMIAEAAAELRDADESTSQREGIPLSNGNVIPKGDYALFRLLDEEGKTRVLLLGINSTPYEDSVDADWPDDGYQVNLTMIRIAQTMHMAGKVSAKGLEWYFYSPKAIEMGWWADARGSWSSYITRIDADELPREWPMAFLRRIKCETADGNDA